MTDQEKRNEALRLITAFGKEARQWGKYEAEIDLEDMSVVREAQREYGLAMADLLRFFDDLIGGFYDD